MSIKLQPHNIVMYFLMNIAALYSNDGHCQRPETTKHSHIEVDSTAIGGVVTYQCDDGFEPTERRVTVCSSTGHWVPDTAAFRCTEPGVHVCTCEHLQKSSDSI